MTYILQTRFQDELPHRKDYLFQTFHLYFVEIHRAADFIELHSFPFVEDNIILLYGHAPWVVRYFNRYGSIHQKKLKIINSCYPDRIVPLLNQRLVFYSKVNADGVNDCYDGDTYGFAFPITNSELDAFNCAQLPFEQQIAFAYERVA